MHRTLRAWTRRIQPRSGRASAKVCRASQPATAHGGSRTGGLPLLLVFCCFLLTSFCANHYSAWLDLQWPFLQTHLEEGQGLFGQGIRRWLIESSRNNTQIKRKLGGGLLPSSRRNVPI